ncbi:MAG: response regulator [Lachnospiraceae bacterium]|nr:response regulator [Lachnospiraceae bacterium]
MKSLLIVEDEKMIRQGIVTMVKRSPVPVEEVLDCRNGEEALEILRSRKIDVMFTDIRMPKMDGISLIRHLEELPEPPRTIVISGYEDFNYAVEAMRGGVSDYLLKPIEREKVYELLSKLDKELEREQTKKSAGRRLGRQQLRYAIVSRQIPEEEYADLETKFAEEKEYLCCICCCSHRVIEDEADRVQLCGIEGQSVFFLRPDQETKLQPILEEYCVGVSQTHRGIREVRSAYEEALAARKTAFITGKRRVTADEITAGWGGVSGDETGRENLSAAVSSEAVPFGAALTGGVSAETAFYGTRESIPGNFTDQFVQLFGTEKVQNGLKQLENYYFQARRGKIDAEQLMETTQTILEQLLETYKNVLEADMAGYMRLRQPLTFNDAASFLEEFRSWILQMREIIAIQFSDYRNKEKINMAVAYIKEHYDRELNMAMVSNYISMNYSLFSLSFKQYTGMNFVSYLKMIRIREAKRLLEETDEKIIEISQRVGYENEKHFMKTFKSVCGVSPSEYRKNMQMGRNRE